MSTLTVRNLDESVKTRLRVQAAQHGWAMEEEVRRILTVATQPVGSNVKLGSRIQQRFATLGSVEMPARQMPRAAPVFES